MAVARDVRNRSPAFKKHKTLTFVLVKIIQSKCKSPKLITKSEIPMNDVPHVPPHQRLAGYDLFFMNEKLRLQASAMFSCPREK